MRIVTVFILTPVLALVGWLTATQTVSYTVWLWCVFFALLVFYLFQFIKRKPEILYVSGTDVYMQEVVGESNYQKTLKSICGGYAKGGKGYFKKTQAVLVLENDNKHDSNAVRVDINGLTVGYLSRNDAKLYRKKLKAAGKPNLIIKCDAAIVGGWSKGFLNKGKFGVRLDLPVDQL